MTDDVSLSTLNQTLQNLRPCPQNQEDTDGRDVVAEQWSGLLDTFNELKGTRAWTYD